MSRIPQDVPLQAPRIAEERLRQRAVQALRTHEREGRVLVLDGLARQIG